MGHKAYGIDLGTTNIKIYHNNGGVIVDEKNILALDHEGRIIAIGDEAFRMNGKTPENITVSFPMKGGVIADFTNMQELLRLFLEQAGAKFMSGSKDFFIAVPNNITDVEKRSFTDLVASSKMRVKKVRIVEKPIADGVGMGLDVKSPTGSMILDIGGDTTEISILSLGGIVISKLIPIGGNKLDEDIVMHIKKESNVIIGQKSAEDLKIHLADACGKGTDSMEVMGRNLVSGLPCSLDVPASMVYDAIKEDLFNIMDNLRDILEHTPPEISSDIIHAGVNVTGGCSQIADLEGLIKQETNLKSNFYEDPGDTVIKGIGMIIENDDLQSLAYQSGQMSYM